MRTSPRPFSASLATLAVAVVLSLAACSGDDDGGDDDGSACSGDVTECALPELSQAQQDTFCDTLLAAIDDGPGTRYTCEENGLFLEVSSRADCVAVTYGASCPTTGGELIDCYKAAADDVCAALAEDGACGPVLANAEVCVGG